MLFLALALGRLGMYKELISNTTESIVDGEVIVVANPLMSVSKKQALTCEVAGSTVTP